MDPHIRAVFRHQIDRHVRGMLAGVGPTPNARYRFEGTVTDSNIRVTLPSGEVRLFRGGRYAERKRNGCYAPLMPTPVKGAS